MRSQPSVIPRFSAAMDGCRIHSCSMFTDSSWRFSISARSGFRSSASAARAGRVEASAAPPATAVCRNARRLMAFNDSNDENIGASLPFDNLPQRPPVDISECHGAVVALQHDGILRGLGDVHGGAGGTVDFHVLLHREAIEDHADEFRVFVFL